MKKKVLYFFVVVLLCGSYGAFLVMNQRFGKTGEFPVIEVSNEALEVSVKAKEKTLLQGIKAFDKEDGDISSKVFIESISEFDDQDYRTITYGVFDSDDNLTRATRKLKYNDYEKPEFYLNKALCFNYMNDDSTIKEYIRAKSKVDGDITSKITMRSDSVNNYFTFSVKDSCGGESEIKLKAEILNTKPQIEIELSDYLIKVEKGTDIDPKSYIENITYMGIEDDSLSYDVKVTNNYNPDKEGMYEFIYRIERSNGDYGITKLVVIVE